MKHLACVSKATPAKAQQIDIKSLLFEPGILNFNELADFATWTANTVSGFFGYTVAPAKSGAYL
jgi:hypothetical protein